MLDFPKLSRESRVQLEQALSRFEDAWRQGQEPSIDDYVDTGCTDVRAVLIELVHTDLECRLKVGQVARVESYLQRYPELTLDPNIVLQLIKAEFTLRRRFEPSLLVNECFDRFPGYATQLRELLKSSDLDIVATTSVGQPICRYRIIRSHAQGGLGKIFLAADTELPREVALKEMKGDHARNPLRQAQFVLEAEITGSLEHPGIVPVYGLGHYADGRPFYAMRFIRGDSLEEAIKHYHESSDPQPTRGERVIRFRKLLGRFLDVCNAMAYAHSRSVLHRDLKPGNIMLGKYGETLVVDWGLAGLVNQKEQGVAADEVPLRLSPISHTAPTLNGKVSGTPAFMSPEQATGQLDKLGPASDIYSLGATLYYLLTGKPPFCNIDLTQVLVQVQKGEFLSPHEVSPDVPAALEAICLKAMALRPEDRYASCRDLAEDIERFLADEPVAAYAETFASMLLRQIRCRPLEAGVIIVVCLVSLQLLITWVAVPFLGPILDQPLRTNLELFGKHLLVHLQIGAILGFFGGLAVDYARRLRAMGGPSTSDQPFQTAIIGFFCGAGIGVLWMLGTVSYRSAPHATGFIGFLCGISFGLLTSRRVAGQMNHSARDLLWSVVKWGISGLIVGIGIGLAWDALIAVANSYE